jgi:hypothetical protein
MFGRENYMPIDLILGDSGDDTLHPDSADDYVHDLQGRLRDSYHLVRQHLGKAARRRKEQYDVKVKPTHFAPGDWVWYFCPRKRAGLSPKWQKWYNGPFLVVKVIDSHTFVIQKSKRSKSVVVHKDKLKLYVGETPKTWLGLQDTELSDRPVTPAQPESTPADGERQPGSSRRRASPTTNDDIDGVVSLPAEGTRPARARRRPRRLRDYVSCVNNLICDSKNVLPHCNYIVSCALKGPQFDEIGEMSKDGPPPICAACGIAFARLRNLKDHLRLASLEARHDDYYSQGTNATRLMDLHGIEWTEISQQDLVRRSKAHRQPASRGRSATRRHRSPSDEDDVPLADRRRKIDAAAISKESPSRSCRISPLVAVSTSRQQSKRQRQDTGECGVYGRAAVEKIERFAQAFIQNADCRDLASATAAWEQSPFGVEPRAAQMLAVAINAAAKVVANTAADYQLIRKSKDQKLILEANSLHRKLSQWRKGSVDSSLPVATDAGGELRVSIAESPRRRGPDVSAHSPTATPTSQMVAEDISTDALDHLVELGHCVTDLRECSVRLMCQDSLDLPMESETAPETVPWTVAKLPTQLETVSWTVVAPPTQLETVPWTVAKLPTQEETVPWTVTKLPTQEDTVPWTVAVPPTTLETVSWTVVAPPTQLETAPCAVPVPTTQLEAAPENVAVPPAQVDVAPETVTLPSTTQDSAPAISGGSPRDVEVLRSVVPMLCGPFSNIPALKLPIERSRVSAGARGRTTNGLERVKDILERLQARKQ